MGTYLVATNFDVIDTVENIDPETRILISVTIRKLKMKEKFARSVSEERGRKRRLQNRQPKLNKNKNTPKLRRRLRILKIVIHKDLAMKKM